MGEYIVEMRDGGLVPIPPDVVNRLGLKPGDNLTLRWSGDHIEMAKLAMWAAEAAEGMEEAKQGTFRVDNGH